MAVYAGGPGAALVRGVIEQNLIFHIAVEALGWTDSEPDWWERLFD